MTAGGGRRRWGLALIVVGVLLGAATPARATTSGFVISPAYQDVVVHTGDTRVQYSLKLSNQAGADQNFRLSVVDFGSLDETGGVAFLGQPATELDHRYGLASWMTLEREAVFVPVGGSVQIVVTIDNRASLASGGHYGAVLATAVNDMGQPITDPRVGVKQVLSSLVLVTKEGGLERSINLVSQKPDHVSMRLPTSIEHRFQNTGNVQVTPRGVVEIRDGAGRVVERGVLNDGSGEILPESFRRYTTPLMTMGKALLPGRYRIVTTYRFDGTTDTKVLTTTFWYFGALVLWGLILVVLALAVVAGWWLFRYLWRRRKRS